MGPATNASPSGEDGPRPGSGAPGAGGVEPTTSNDGFGCGPLQPAGSGPGGAGFGPRRVGGVAPISAVQSASNEARSLPSAARSAASSETPSWYDRISLTRASRPLPRTMRSTAETLSA